MKKISFRMIAYFSIGLMLFFLYFVLMFGFLMNLLGSTNTYQYIFLIGDVSAMRFLFILLFCFITGGAIFSMFFVYPLAYIMNAVKRLSQDDVSRDDYEARAFRADGKIKRPYFLYKEIITNIVIVGDELAQARVERRQLEEAKNEWIAGVSHDLKTPLSYVTGYASLIMNHEYQWEMHEIEPYIEQIYKKAMLVETMIEDLNASFFLDHMDASQLRLQAVDFVAFIRDVVADVANDPRAQAYELVFESTPMHAEMMLDQTLMRRAVSNVLRNALEHNPEGTEIVTRITGQGDILQLEISDNGLGMPQDALLKVFKRYYSSKESPGLHQGLGLSIVRQIIDAHHAEIDVQSTLGKGTTFCITLRRGGV